MAKKNAWSLPIASRRTILRESEASRILVSFQIAFLMALGGCANSSKSPALLKRPASLSENSALVSSSQERAEPEQLLIHPLPPLPGQQLSTISAAPEQSLTRPLPPPPAIVLPPTQTEGASFLPNPTPTDFSEHRNSPVNHSNRWEFNPTDQIEAFRQWKPLNEIEQQAIQMRIFQDRSPLALDVADLVGRTLLHSKKHKQLEIQPTEARQLINKEYGAFDPTAFVRSQFDVQNLQQKQENNQVVVGLKKNHLYGGNLEINNAIGVQDGAGAFRLADQGVASLNVQYTQELLRDGGKDVVLSRGVIASYQFDQRYAQSASESSILIQKTIGAYWQLYKARAKYFLQQALVDVANKLCRQIEDRSNQFERSTNSLEQARALHLEASADVVDAQTQVLQAQDNLYRLVNDPSMDSNWCEIITGELPILTVPAFEVMEELSIAIQNRPEIKEKIAAIRQNAMEMQVSLNQLLPKLSVSLKTSMNGFEENRDYFGAASNLDRLPASATAGANMEMLWFNRTAKAKNKESNLRASRLFLEYEDQIQGIRQDVLIAMRVIQNSKPKIELRNLTLLARQKEIDVITEKIWINPEEGSSIVVQLEQLFQAINRLIRTQQQLVDAKVELQTSIVDLMRAKGVLVSQSEIPANLQTAVPRLFEAAQIRREQKSTFKQEVDRRVMSEPMLWQNQ